MSTDICWVDHLLCRFILNPQGIFVKLLWSCKYYTASSLVRYARMLLQKSRQNKSWFETYIRYIRLICNKPACHSTKYVTEATESQSLVCEIMSTAIRSLRTWALCIRRTSIQYLQYSIANINSQYQYPISWLFRSASEVSGKAQLAVDGSLASWRTAPH